MIKIKTKTNQNKSPKKNSTQSVKKRLIKTRDETLKQSYCKAHAIIDFDYTFSVNEVTFDIETDNKPHIIRNSSAHPIHFNSTN